MASLSLESAYCDGAGAVMHERTTAIAAGGLFARSRESAGARNRAILRAFAGLSMITDMGTNIIANRLAYGTVRADISAYVYKDGAKNMADVTNTCAVVYEAIVTASSGCVGGTSLLD